MYDELVKRLRDCVDSLCGECKYEHMQKPGNFVPCMNAIITEAADAIEELSKPRWIPVTERLPEERHAVIVWEPKYLNPYICVLSEGDWYVFGGYGVKVFGVTHWMPLPEPPKEG